MTEAVISGYDQPLPDHLVGLPRRGQSRHVPGVPARGAARGIRRLARSLPQPVSRPAGRRTDSQLGRRPPNQRARGRRRRRRGGVSQYRAALLSDRAGGGAGTQERCGLPPPAGGAACPQPLARRLRPGAAGTPRRPRPDLLERRGAGGRGRALDEGQRAGRRAAARGLARHPVGRAAVLARVRAAVGRLRGARDVRHPPLGWQRDPELRPLSVRQRASS